MRCPVCNWSNLSGEEFESKTEGIRVIYTVCPKCDFTAPNNFWIKEDPRSVIDPINHPSHYIFGDYEVINILRAWLADSPVCPYIGFLWSSMQQYLFRFPHKGKPVSDLKKAEWYLQRLIKEYDDKGT